MSYLKDLHEMPPNLQGLYQLRSDFGEALKRFRSWRALWKASVLCDDFLTDEDENAAENAEAEWQSLVSLERQIRALHKQLGIPGALGIELPIDEYQEKVTPLAVAERRKQAGK